MGTNLLKGTFAMNCGISANVIREGVHEGFQVGHVNYTRTNSNPETYFEPVALSNVVTPKPGEYYTLSFYAKKRSGSQSSKVYCFFFPACCESGVSSQGLKGYSADGYTPITLSENWEKYWITWKVRSNVTGGKNLVVARCQPNVGQNIDFDFCGIKFELGDVATPWSPSPLDIPSYVLTEDMFEQGSIDQNINGIYESIKTQSEFTNQLRTKELIPCTGEKLAIHVSSGYKYFICFFSGQSNLKIYQDWTGHDKWTDIPEGADHFALLFKRYPENTALQPSEIAQICGGGVDVLSTKATASTTLSRVNDGADAFTIVYDSPSGLEFSDTVKSIAITAKVFKGGKELTDAQVNAFGAIKWYQVGVAAAIATGKTLTLTAPKEVYATLEN